MEVAFDKSLNSSLPILDDVEINELRLFNPLFDLSSAPAADKNDLWFCTSFEWKFWLTGKDGFEIRLLLRAYFSLFPASCCKR